MSNDWQAALLPVYLAHWYRPMGLYRDARPDFKTFRKHPQLQEYSHHPQPRQLVFIALSRIPWRRIPGKVLSSSVECPVIAGSGRDSSTRAARPSACISRLRRDAFSETKDQGC